MEPAIQLELTETEKPTRLVKQFPMQEQFGASVTFKFERRMTEILVERSAETGSVMTAPLFIP